MRGNGGGRFLIMKEKAYIPITGYKGRFNTQISKQNFLVGLILNGNRISRQWNSITVDDVLYSVPTGQTFFLIGACLGGKKTTGTDYILSLIIGGTASPVNPILTLTLQPGTGGSVENVFLSFPIPVKLNYGETIATLGISVNLHGIASIVGYEIPTAFIPNLI